MKQLDEGKAIPGDVVNARFKKMMDDLREKSKKMKRILAIIGTATLLSGCVFNPHVFDNIDYSIKVKDHLRKQGQRNAIIYVIPHAGQTTVLCGSDYMVAGTYSTDTEKGLWCMGRYDKQEIELHPIDNPSEGPDVIG